MTHLINFLIFFFLLTTNQTATLKVDINNIQNTKGTIRVALYNSPVGFPRDNEAVIEEQVINNISNKTNSVYFRNLPYGNYAISLFHDENNNEAMDYNLIGIPKEGYGFSNNVKPQLKAPSFNDTKVKVNCSYTSIKIDVIYR